MTRGSIFIGVLRPSLGRERRPHLLKNVLPLIWSPLLLCLVGFVCAKNWGSCGDDGTLPKCIQSTYVGKVLTTHRRSYQTSIICFFLIELFISIYSSALIYFLIQSVCAALPLAAPPRPFPCDPAPCPMLPQSTIPHTHIKNCLTNCLTRKSYFTPISLVA